MLIEEFDRIKHEPEEVKELLSMAVGSPSPEKLVQLLDDFYMSASHILFIARDNNDIVGVIGIDYTNRLSGIINHIAVIPDKRKRGFGSQLISHVIKKLKLESIEAETDQDAVNFYRACGFTTEEIKSLYPGVRRFRCIRHLMNLE